MTGKELEEELARLQLLQSRTREGIHDLLNVLALIKGEVDLAVERAHSAVDAFYLRYPEFRQ